MVSSRISGLWAFSFKVPITRNYLIRKSFQNDEEWRLFHCDSTLGCRVIQDFDLYKLNVPVVTSQQVHKVVWNHRKLNISRDFFWIELKLQLLHSSQSSMICPLWHFPFSTMGSRPSSFKGENQSFPPSRSVVCSRCSFSRCERIWALHSPSTRRSVKLWSNARNNYCINKAFGIPTALVNESVTVNQKIQCEVNPEVW